MPDPQTPNAAPLQRVAILGGGIAGLATAFGLVQQEQAAGRRLYDITVHQLGWRVGGKGASGRNREPGQGLRIEEHGLHVWFGCYDAAWGMLQQCYDGLGRGPDMLRLFQGQTDTPYMEDVGGWKLWPISFPRKYGSLPRTVPSAPPTLGEELAAQLLALGRYLMHLAERWATRPRPAGESLLQRVTADAAAATALAGVLGSLERQLAQGTGLQGASALLDAATAVRRALGLDLRPADLGDEWRRLRILFELGYTVVRGLIVDRVWDTGFDALDKEDTRAWFRRHGADDEVLGSAPLRALYDLCFAYRGGRVDTEHADFAAGAALTTVLRIVVGYPDYVVYEMRAGMGEVVIAPIYQFLVKQGVSFEFFHQVDSLDLSPQGGALEAVNITVQAKVNEGQRYAPLFDVHCPADGIDSLAAWPSTPFYEQLQDADALRGINLESHWSGWKGVGTQVLRAGEDFDVAVLATSLESVRELCAGFPQRLPAWGAMFDAMQTVQTVSAQLWMTRSLQALGWSTGAVPIDAGPEPLDVWADRSDVLRRECWSDDLPKSLQYLCGPLDERWAQGLPRDPAFPAAGLAAATATTVSWLQRNGPVLWPEAAAGGGFDWNVLRDPGGAQGPARLGSQYLRANIDPSERYVLSVAGSTACRLPADGSGLTNLVLAGDWTLGRWNAGCIESAVESGLKAAEVVARR